MAAETQQPSSSSSDKYDVFLSFRGEDTRKSFTDHLYSALVRAGIRTFRDNEELKRGEAIKPTILKAIKQSEISIPIFSKNYASSRCCLQELAKIMECKQTGCQIVWPIFYHVEPSDVRNQTGSFAKAFLKHEQMQSKEMVNIWRRALKEAGSLLGWESKNSSEANLISCIVQKALNELNKTTLEVAKHPVGINSHVEVMTRLLDLQSKDVQFVGIHGIGGIGKTTIAKAVFNTIFRHFEGWCFLANVRQRASQCQGLVELQNKLVSNILQGTDLGISIDAEGVNVIKKRFCNKKVLIILDDVDQNNQIHALAGAYDWFGSGSRIIITTRDEHILTMNHVDPSKIYKPKELDDSQSLQLFCNYAFNSSIPPKDFKKLSMKVVCKAKGLPLALEELGSSLHGKSTKEWEIVLKKLEKIKEAPRPSYDGLDDKGKQSHEEALDVQKSHEEMHVCPRGSFGSASMASLQEPAEPCQIRYRRVGHEIGTQVANGRISNRLSSNRIGGGGPFDFIGLHVEGLQGAGGDICNEICNNVIA